MQQPPKLFILPLTVHFPKGFVGFSVSLPVLRRGRLSTSPHWEAANSPRITVKSGLFCGRTGSSAPTVLWTSPGKFVGVDAHIDPAVKTVFTKIQCEFDGAPRGDVGIAPYAFLGKSNKHKNPDAVRCIGIFFQDRGISIYASRLSTGIGFSCRSRGSGSIRTD